MNSGLSIMSVTMRLSFAVCALLSKCPNSLHAKLELTNFPVNIVAAQSGGGGGGGGMMQHINPDRQNAVITHGTFMGFAFAFLFPLGAIIIRSASFRGLVWVHAGIQILAYTLALVGLGLGVYIAIYPESQVRGID